MWPTEPLPVRGVWAYGFVQVEGEPDAFMVYRSTPGRDIPEGLFLGELMTLDLESSEAIVDFMERFGPLGPDWRDRRPDIDSFMHGGLTAPQYAAATIESVRALAKSNFYTPEYVAALVRSAELEATWSSWPGSYVTHDDIALLTLDEFRIGARVMRDVVRAWRVYSGTLSSDGLPELWESHYPSPRSIEAAVGWMVHEQLDLSPFSPAVALDTDPEWPVSLRAALHLQVFNEIVKGSVALRCRNETCPYGVWYVSRSWNTESRRYCSPECADMQTARERRRRVRDANRLAKQGLTAEQIAVQMGTTTERVGGWLAAAAKRRKGGK